jgi:hypothetical protein
VLTGGYSIERYQPITKQWQIVSSVGAVRLSVTPSGDPAVISESGKTYMKKNSKWVRIKGCASDLAFGHNGQIFKLGCTRNRAGFRIYSYVGKERGWRRMLVGGGTSLAVDAAGDPWIINAHKTVFKWDSLAEKWRSMGLRGQAHEIAAGPAGHVYVLAGELVDGGGYRIHRWAGDKVWYPIPGKGAMHISIGMGGKPYIVD